jgi:hypothetical protein
MELQPVIRTDTSGGVNGGRISGTDLSAFGPGEVWITRRCSDDIALGDASTDPRVLAAHEKMAWNVCRQIYARRLLANVKERFALNPGIGDAGQVYWVITDKR